MGSLGKGKGGLLREGGEVQGGRFKGMERGKGKEGGVKRKEGGLREKEKGKEQGKGKES